MASDWEDVPASEWEDVTSPKQYKIGAEGFSDAMKEVVSGAGKWDKFWAGFGTLGTDTYHRAIQALAQRGFTPSESQQIVASRAIQSDPWGLTGNIAANLATIGVPLAKGQGLLTKALSPAGATVPQAIVRAVAPSVAAGAVGGATTLATQPTLEGESSLGNAGTSALTSAAADMAFRGLGRVAAPVADKLEESAKTLIDKGVKMTPGQLQGANSMAGRIEQMMTSYPLIGHVIKVAREGANADFVRSQLNNAMPKGNPRVLITGRQALKAVDEAIDAGFETTLGKVKNPVPPDAYFKKDVTEIINGVADSGLKKKVNQFGQSIDWNAQNGRQWKDIENKISQEIGDYIHSTSGDDRKYARALIGIKEAWRNNLTRNGPTGIKYELEGLNKNYQAWLRVAEASGYAGAEDGVFSASQYWRSVKKLSEPSASGVKQQFAVGDAALQKEAEAAYKHLRDTVGNSYTFDRWALGSLLAGGAGGALNEWWGGPSYLTALAATPLVMSPQGRKYMMSGYGFQQPLGQGLRQMAPYASQVARAVSEKK